MQDRIRLLNVAVDTASTQTAYDATMEYMQEEGSKVVYFLNSETLLLLEEDSDLRMTVEESELILPGSISVNNSMNQVLQRKKDFFFIESYFDAIFDYAVEMGKEILIVAESQDRFISIQKNIHEKRPYITLSGVSLSGQEQTPDYIVNEINSVAPDILLIALEEKKQLELLQLYRNQMNAGLMLFTGAFFYNKAVSEAEVPVKIRKLKIENLYKWYQKDGRIRTFFSNLKLKLKLKRQNKERES